MPPAFGDPPEGPKRKAPLPALRVDQAPAAVLHLRRSPGRLLHPSRLPSRPRRRLPIRRQVPPCLRSRQDLTDHSAARRIAESSPVGHEAARGLAVPVVGVSCGRCAGLSATSAKVIGLRRRRTSMAALAMVGARRPPVAAIGDSRCALNRAGSKWTTKSPGTSPVTLIASDSRILLVFRLKVKKGRDDGRRT